MNATLGYTLTDSATMLRRNLRHQLRYPSLTLMLAGMPILFLLLFVYVFGGQLGPGSPTGGTHAGPARVPHLHRSRHPDHDGRRRPPSAPPSPSPWT